MGNYLSRERQRERALKEYVRHFDDKTDKGKVLFVDTSKEKTKGEFLKNLTDDEESKRREWAGIRSGLKQYYTMENALKKLTVEGMLQLRVAPPFLGYLAIAPRTQHKEGRSRLYLDEIYAWDDFKDSVQGFSVPAALEQTRVGMDVLFRSLDDIFLCTDESHEANFMFRQVLDSLQDAGLLEHRGRVGVLQLPDIKAKQKRTPKKPVLGQADYFLVGGETKTVPIEFKSTQNLLLPEKADVVIRRYNKAVKKVKRHGKRTINWCNIGHSVAQLTYYMFRGGSRYGVLCSASRSYFFMVLEGTDADPKVYISDAWFTGQPDFLRAWAYFNSLAKVNGDFQPPDNWEDNLTTLTPTKRPDQGQPEEEDTDDGDDSSDDFMTSDDSTDERPSGSTDRDQPGEDTDGPDEDEEERPAKRPRRHDQDPPAKRPRRHDQDPRAGGPTTTQCMTWLDPGLAPSIPRVDGKEIELVEFLSAGNSDVYLAHWKGGEVVVKMFDYFKCLGWFKDELRAYEHLKDAWGVLVPEPYFIAEKFGLLLLGMQVGRIPSKWNRKFERDLDNLFRTLRRAYGFYHLDQEPRNVVYLPGKNGTDTGPLVAIDLEAHKIRRVPIITPIRASKLVSAGRASNV